MSGGISWIRFRWETDAAEKAMSDGPKALRTKNLLFISGSIGLGHVVRDCAIADRMRIINPDINIKWLAGQPAADFLSDRGEDVYAGEKGFADMSSAAGLPPWEQASKLEKLENGSLWRRF